MSFRTKLVEEIKVVGAAALFFGCWIGMLLLLKWLILAEYQISSGKLSVIVIGALILAKVVVVLEHVPLGKLHARQPAWVDVVLRTVLYGFGVLVVLVLEKAFDGRHEYGGFVASLTSLLDRANVYHVWANALCISGALLIYNVASVIRRFYPDQALLRLLLLPLPDEDAARAAKAHAE